MIGAVPARLRWLSVSDPGLASLRSAARAAIVMPVVFAIADKVIADPQIATFAAFGSFAMLVLVEFGGPFRSRLVAYVSLASVLQANERAFVAAIDEIAAAAKNFLSSLETSAPPKNRADVAAKAQARAAQRFSA